MKTLIYALVIATVALTVQAHAEAQVFVRAGNRIVSVGNGRVAFGNDRGLFQRVAVNQAIRNNNRAVQVQLLQQQQLNAFRFNNNRNNFRAVSFVNQRNDLADLALLRQLQQYNDFSRVSSFNQQALFDPRQNILLNQAALRGNNRVRFIGSGNCR